VYKVFDKAMEREVALKAVKPEISQKAEAFEGFARELKAERGIVHKNIARIFELSMVKGTPFITMEYVAGKDLKFLLKEKKRLPIVEAFSIAKQLFSGLAQAHKSGALHLDLRPDNIIIDKEGTAKIMDLGIARLFRAKGIIRAVAGMPQYMSPEQLEGQEADARSDIFAVGAIVYEMLTGSLPPVGERPKSPRELNPGVPRELSLLILKCLEPEKEKRYQTAQEIRAELEEIETGASQATAEPSVQPPTENPVQLKSVIEPAPMAAAEPGRAARPARAKKKTRPQRAFALPSKTVFPALALLSVIILAIILWRLVFKPSKGAPPLPTAPPQLSLAVLPFEDLSPAKDRQPLGAAMAETLIRSLGKIDNLFIPAAASSSSFQGKARDSRLVGRRLHVDHYLEGTFEDRENKIKIDARLLRADSGAPLWSGQYERSSGEIFAIQEEIAQAVVKSLGGGVPPDGASALRPGAPANFEAYDLYAQARFLMNKKGKDNLEKAIDLFAKAGAKDPAFALAFTGIADVYIQLADGHHWTPDKAVPKAKEVALKALLLDAGLSEAHTALARIKTNYEWDFTWAEKEYREALRIDPDNAAAHQAYALLLSALGRHGEAVKESQAAQTLNPLSSEVKTQAGLVLYFGRLYEQAEAEVRKAVATDPLYPGHYLCAALVQIQLGQIDQAWRSLEEAEDLGSDPMEVKLRRAYIHARQGQRQEVGRILTEAFNAAKQTYVSQLSLALVYAGLNERDQAIACLENAFADRDASLIFMRVHPFLDSVRGDIRFVGLLQKIGLGPY
jgi:serine/threonine-protein kinase